MTNEQAKKILKAKLECLAERMMYREEQNWLKELRAYRKIDDCLRAESEDKE